MNERTAQELEEALLASNRALLRILDDRNEARAEVKRLQDQLDARVVTPEDIEKVTREVGGELARDLWEETIAEGAEVPHWEEAPEKYREQFQIIARRWESR